jgi:hypothetical protein
LDTKAHAPVCTEIEVESEAQLNLMQSTVYLPLKLIKLRDVAPPLMTIG